MAITNFREWSVFYHELLVDKYCEFCNLFNKDEQPDYHQFVKFVWLNTSKYKNHINGRMEARINSGL